MSDRNSKHKVKRKEKENVKTPQEAVLGELPLGRKVVRDIAFVFFNHQNEADINFKNM